MDQLLKQQVFIELTVIPKSNTFVNFEILKKQIIMLTLPLGIHPRRW